ncbi:MAG: WecB/TagA/CpsF family glycosyltransferase [Nitrospirales bacterium]|nr:WecB/TagA/CpsF family glycosyltransferase [Nitrospirales bacterium]
MKPQRIEILGVPVDCITMDEAVDWADSMMTTHRPCTILAVNPEKVIRAQQGRELLERLRSADLLVPDGIGVVLGLRLLGLGRVERVPGSELMPKLCELAVSKGYTVFLFGGSQEVSRQTVSALCERYPGIRIVGAQHGYVPEEDMPGVVAGINETSPDLLFVALGSPKQELWMARYLPLLNVKVCQGVGGTFDVIAGRVKRAPLIFRTLHLEWFYRLLSQPNRILRQTALPLFVFQILRKRIMG